MRRIASTATPADSWIALICPVISSVALAVFGAPFES
jgi:hypothetical protein